MNYSVNHFINKFQAIPESKWCVGELYNKRGQSCALGHCGARYSQSLEGGARELYSLFKNFGLNIYTVNDGKTPQYPQPTPDQRILAALYDMKAMEAVKEVEKIINELWIPDALIAELNKAQ